MRHLRWWSPFFWGPFALLLVVLGLLWTWGAHGLPYLFPPLGKVGSSLGEHPGYFTTNALITLREAVAGLVIGVAVAFLLALLVSEIGVARRALMPLAVVLNVTPLVAIAPILVVALGFGPGPKILLTSLICFFPVLINVSSGLRAVPREVVQVFRSVHASRWEILWQVRVPQALPYLFAALQIVFPLSVIGAVVAELSAAGSAKGLGTVIQIATSRNNLPTIWASIMVLAVMGSLMLLLVTVAQRRVLHWHESHQTQE